jgi:hypothetical protein
MHTVLLRGRMVLGIVLQNDLPTFMLSMRICSFENASAVSFIKACDNWCSKNVVQNNTPSQYKQKSEVA